MFTGSILTKLPDNFNLPQNINMKVYDFAAYMFDGSSLEMIPQAFAFPPGVYIDNTDSDYEQEHATFTQTKLCLPEKIGGKFDPSTGFVFPEAGESDDGAYPFGFFFYDTPEEFREGQTDSRITEEDKEGGHAHPGEI
jgi:hypothetical protein